MRNCLGVFFGLFFFGSIHSNENWRGDGWVVSNNFPSCRDSHPFFWAVWLMEGEGAGGGSGHAPPHTMDGGEDAAAQVGVIIQYKLEGGGAGLALG